MNNNKKLFFINIIAKALDSDDPRQALRDAFEKIKKLGDHPQYSEGYHQFKEFVKTAILKDRKKDGTKIHEINEVIYKIICKLATDTFQGDERQRESLISALNSNPQMKAEFDRIKTEMTTMLDLDAPLMIEVTMGNQVIESFDAMSDKTTISPILPGPYIIQFSNGRVLWEGEILPEDVIWEYAYPDLDLPLAAETDKKLENPTRTVTFLDGELIMHVFAGLENGRITIQRGTKN